MQFSKMVYTRPPVNELIAEFNTIKTRIEGASNSDEAISLFWQFEKVTASLQTAQSLASIRYTINTKDEFYDNENTFFDENSPTLSDKRLEVYRALLKSKFRPQLEQALGAHIFNKMDIECNAMNAQILPLMAEENALTSEYDKLCASAQIEFDGKKLTLSELSPYKQSTNRQQRHDAYVAEGKWFTENSAKLDEIYDKLVANRTAQSKGMGYDNFVPLGYVRMQRLGYGEADIQKFREQIKKYVVPAVTKIKQKQAQELGIDKIMLWDNMVYYKNGNAMPKGTADELLAAGLKMYAELSPETAAFMQMMMDNQLFDVLSRPGKAPGGYCTYLPNYKAPFIFSNFNGTADDVDVLTHEAGHAFAAYLASRQDLPTLLAEPGLESCEIHSMSMEFLTSDYHELFFKEDTEKYKFFHTAEALTFLPYGTMVDEFQHIMYTNPTLTPQQRHDVWKKLESEYRPWLDCADVPFYSNGANWQRQLHIYDVPFYYIDYCLAQSVALQFYASFMKDKNGTWERYLALTQKAGTSTYTGLVEAAGFNSPFEEGTLKDVTLQVMQSLGL